VPDKGLCGVTWGVCPEHGATLDAALERTTCRFPGCALTWDYDRFSAPCPEPAGHRVSDSRGGVLPLCGGHVIAVRSQLPGAVITPLDDASGGTAE
jgi:hypothetical protein